jgi:hypothetical protein
MSEPIVFTSTHRIKEGKLDGFKQLSGEMTPANIVHFPR